MEGGSFDDAMNRLVGTYLREDAKGVSLTEEGEKAVRFLRVPNYVLPSLYFISGCVLFLGVISLLSPIPVLGLLPVTLVLLGALGIGADMTFYIYTRSYAREFLRIRDKPLLKV